MSRPRLVSLSSRLVPGLLAFALFGVFAAVVVGTDFTGYVGFPEDLSVTAEIGYALFDFTELQETNTESFLVSFILIAIVLDAALDASLVLATREGPDESVRPSAFDGPSTGSTGDTEADGTAATDGGAVDGTTETDGKPASEAEELVAEMEGDEDDADEGGDEA
ncbi:hypothetical protein Halru_0798 [Halovivax ruber XH-70]|uniref:Uncharacterized protein n=1 Tax=Halovivax ruber (strain DSM 18193 / JCM 13892 / XH-70) TaxID=797302 RepID=L0I9N6_HALRX|nr:hypothetical protein [Halovivax ruber]AGB15424.1 hypothetical protein Halru_0798 [Halovivax ruber XH-70]